MKPADRCYFIDGSDAHVMMRGNNAPLVRLWREKRGGEREGLLKCRWYGASTTQAPVRSNIEALFFANAAFFLARLLRRIVRILLPFVSRTKRLRYKALDKASSNQLVPSRPQEKLQ